MGAGWEWLLGLAADINGNTVIIDAINAAVDFFRGGVEFVSRFQEQVETSIQSGVTVIGDTISTIGQAVNNLLFGGLLPKAYADTQITESVNSAEEGSIGKSISDSANAILAQIGTAVGLAQDVVNGTIQGILDGISAVFTGGGTGTGADRALSNLLDVAINKALIFDNNTGGGNMSRSIGYANDDLYLKLPDKDNSVFIQGNDRNDNSDDDVTLLSIGQKKLRLYDQTNSLEGEANGTMAVYGDTVLMKVGGVVKNFASYWYRW